MSSKFKVGSLTTQIMLAKSNLTAAFEDELAAQQKLSKQQAAAEKVSDPSKCIVSNTARKINTNHFYFIDQFHNGQFTWEANIRRPLQITIPGFFFRTATTTVLPSSHCNA
jgi:hypothetical protein